MLQDQTTIDKNNKLTPKVGKEISSSNLQNPTDPDATYRQKYCGNTGYVANIVETFNYDLKQNIELIPGELVGRKPSTNKVGYDKFTVDNEKNVIISCPNGAEPEESYNSSKSYTAKFNKDTCEKCPDKDKCPIKPQKKFNTISVSEKRRNTDLQREKMSQSEYIEITNQRAGVEGIPAVIRRRYKIDNMPIRGLLRSKLWVAFKIAAYNFKKLLVKLLEISAATLVKFFIVTFVQFYSILKFNKSEFKMV